nr:MAG TPA: hypothetical protein [Caudoviricetes sp.]
MAGALDILACPYSSRKKPKRTLYKTCSLGRNKEP